jgi:hypothetical protein
MNRAPLAASVLVILAIIGCNLRFGGALAIQGSGKRASEPRQTGEFTGISLEGSADVDVKIGDKTSVVVEGDDNLLKLITTEVKDGTLVIANRESYSTRIGIQVHITTPKLNFASISGSGTLSTGGIEAVAFDASIPGSGKMTVDGLRTEKVDASISGSGEVEINNLKANTFMASLVGSGSIRISGAAESVDATVSGSGNLDLNALAANDVSVSISGSGNADVRASGKLTANVSGSGSVSYSGEPMSVVKDISGSGSVQAQ